MATPLLAEPVSIRHPLRRSKPDMPFQTTRPQTRLKYREGSRLVYADASSATRQFWEEHWGPIGPDTFALADHGYLQWLEVPFRRHLPKVGCILEAGCGPGQVLQAMRVRGYEVEGIEWAADLVERVKQLRPDMPIRAGDATAMDVPDGRYSGVVSLGVAEHRRAGPEPFIVEARRVLKRGGVLLISVPHYHFIRRLRYGRQRGESPTLSFYQYAFAPADFARTIERCGLQVIARYGYAFWESLREDLPRIAAIERLPLIGRRLPGLFNRSQGLSRLCGHMALFVATKPG
jgi:SAM-dependent methyltransferase